MGFTFKENCPDVRNTKVIDIVKTLEAYNVNVTIYDPWANSAVAKHEYGVDIVDKLPVFQYDGIIMAVAHEIFSNIEFSSLMADNCVCFDVKGTLNKEMIDQRL